MVAVSLSFVLSGLFALSAARELPNRIEKRQGTLIQSTDATHFGSCTVPQIKGPSTFFSL